MAGLRAAGAAGMRQTPEWVGTSHDQAPPARVKARIWKRDPNCVGCGLPTGDVRKPQYDHIVAICNGGENRESNLQILCGGCHRLKSYTDVAVKSSNARRLKKRLGLQKQARPMPGSKASGLRKRMNGTVERW